MTSTTSPSAPAFVARIRSRLLGNKRNVRRMRRVVRHPRLWARLAGTAVPCSYCASTDALLDRPESIQLSASGKRVVVSNSGGRSITVYDIDSAAAGRPRLRLVDRFADERLLQYVHGAAFTCRDELYLALGEYSNSLAAVAARCLESESSSRVRWTLEGVANGLDNPADIAIHPAGRYLVIANREASGLCFFTLPPDLRTEPPRLVLSRTVAELNGERTAAPHGVAFSPDGRFLFVTHKRFFKSRSDSGNSAVSVYRADADRFDRARWLPVAAKDFGREALHHVACHPSGRIIALTNSLGPVEVLSWNPSSRDFTELGRIDVFRQGEGAKGICFTKDGRHLAVTSELDEVLFFDLRRHTSSCGIMPFR